MRFNTLITTLGYVRSLIEKLLGMSLKRNSIQAIYNYHRVAIGLNTSGQPTEKQFASIKEAGVSVVINLAPSSAENSLANEAEVLKSLGITYEHLPVDFKAPTDSDFDAFVGLLNTYEDSEIWVHCAANMRVSAFIYRYRCQVLGHNKEDAKHDMSVIWEPFGAWKKFVSSA